MPKLNLQISESLQGQFIEKELNLLLVFQVNCPGCVLYAMPLFNVLYKKYSNRLGFMGLSTAFEDYEYNNIENTKVLLSDGILVGETKKALTSRDIDKLPYAIAFPVAMDAKMEAADKESVVEHICNSDLNFASLSEVDQVSVKNRVRDYLNRQEAVSMTFTSNQFRGTPTIVLFDDEEHIIDSWFGHVPEEVIVKKIEN